MSLSTRPDHEPLISSRTESVPNGQSYGRGGHIPCDHIAVFEYATCQRRFDGESWTVTPREGNEQGEQA